MSSLLSDCVHFRFMRFAFICTLFAFHFDSLSASSSSSSSSSSASFSSSSSLDNSLSQAEVIFEAAFQGECRSNGPCQQLCFDLHDGTFECACKPGFTLNDNGYSCIENHLLEQEQQAAGNSSGIELNEIGSKSKSTYRNVKKTKTKKLFNFNSCSQIECEAGGTCVQEADDDDDDNDGDESNDNNVNSNNYPKTGSSSFKTNSNHRKSIELSNVNQTSIRPKHRRLHCRCPLGRGGFFCEKPMEATIPRFSGKSYLALPTLRDAEHRMFLQLELRAADPNGLLLYTGEHQRLIGSHFSLTLHRGHLNFRFDFGHGIVEMRSEHPLPLHTWIKVNVTRVHNTASLHIQGQSPVQVSALDKPFQAMHNRLELFLGGSPNISLVAGRVGSQFGFTGCVRQLSINYKKYDFRADSHGDAIDGVGIDECDEDSCERNPCLNSALCSSPPGQSLVCLCPKGFTGSNCELIASRMPYFAGNAFLQLPGIDQNALSYLQMQIVFKADRESGVLLFNGNSDGDDFILIQLNHGYVYFTFDVGNGPATVRTPSKVEIGRWHQLLVSRTTKMAIISIDDQQVNQTVSQGPFSQLSLRWPLWLGGLPKSVFSLNGLSLYSIGSIAVNESFQGCVQTMQVNGRQIDLESNTVVSSNVAACAHQCEKRPCLNGGQCLPAKDAFKCNCTANFKGDRCENEEMVSIPMFYGNSYLHYMEPQILQHINNNKLDLRLRFRAFSPNGLLLWAGSINPELIRSNRDSTHKSPLFDSTAAGQPLVTQLMDSSNAWMQNDWSKSNVDLSSSNPAANYMWLALKDGQLEYQHQLDPRLLPLRLQLSNITRLDDGLWHELHLQRRRNEVLLQVDQAPHVQAQLSVEEQQLSSLVSNQGLYLGGLEDAKWRTGNEYEGGIIGCIAHVHLSLRVKISLVVQASSAVNIRPCI